MANCDNKTATYYQGDDIEFYLVQSDINEDLDANDWQLIFYSNSTPDIVLEKGDMVYVEPQKYYGLIPRAKTKTLISDKFICELAYGTDKKRIATDISFILKDSHSKNYV